MKKGDVLFMDRLTMHASLPNVSDEIRWSFDLRYNRTGDATGRSWFPGFVARSRSNPEYGAAGRGRVGRVVARGPRQARGVGESGVPALGPQRPPVRVG